MTNHASKIESHKEATASDTSINMPGIYPTLNTAAGIAANYSTFQWIRDLCASALFVLCLHLAACTAVPRVTNPVFSSAYLEREASRIAQQPLPFHVSAALSRYRDADEPVYFLVADDFKHTSYSVCSNSPCFYDGRDALTNAMDDCADLRLGTTCSLLYLRRTPLAPNIRFKDRISYKLLRGERSVSPAKAHGKIIYLPGFSGWYNRGYNFPPAMTDADISPALEALESAGWDVDVLNLMHLDRAYAWRQPEMITELLEALIANARNDGYRSVILYGGSRGGAEIIKAVVGGAAPDAVALMEPDWHGPKFDSRGGFNEEHKVRETEISELTAKLPTRRIAFAYFRNSRWYGDVERAEIRQALDATGADYLLIAAPPSLAGHSASWSKRFANVYAGCLHRFFLGEIDSMQACEPAPVDESLYENWALKSRITAGGFRSMSGDEIQQFFADKGLCPYRPGDDSVDETSCHVWQGDERIRSFTNEFDILITTNDLLDFRQTGFCRHNGFFGPTYRCSRIFRVEEDLLAIVPDDRDSIYWYKTVDRELVLERHRRARYSCENRSKLTQGRCRKL